MSVHFSQKNNGQLRDKWHKLLCVCVCVWINYFSVYEFDDLLLTKNMNIYPLNSLLSKKGGNACQNSTKYSDIHLHDI